VNDPQLELDHHAGFQKWEWVAQRVGWAALIMMVVTALTGALSDALLTHAQARAADGSLDIRYDRVTRKRVRATITVTCRVREAALRLWISRDAAKKLDLKRSLAKITTFDLVLTLIISEAVLPAVRRIVDGQPVVVLQDGSFLPKHLDKERVEKDDVLASARERLGIGSLTEVRHAVLEESGGISAIPARPS
jgi:Protein of unknown function (DUF421)